jgi:CheY-like chemotaxis protein
VKLLIVEEDQNFARILTTVLEAEGHLVGLAEGRESAARALATLAPDVVLISVDVHSPPSIQFLEQFRMLPGGHRAATVAIASAHDDRVLRACTASNTDHVLVRPFSVLDLAVLVRGLSPAPVHAPVAAPAGTLHAENVFKIARLWARGANGVLSVHDDSGGELIVLAAGGPVSQDSVPALRRALYGGRVEFQPCEVDGQGEPGALGAILWEESLNAQSPADPRPSRTTVLVPTRLSEMAARIALPHGLGLVVSSLQGPSGLGRLADQYGFSISYVGEALAALSALGLVTLQHAPAMPNVVGGPAPVAPAPAFEVAKPGGPPRTGGDTPCVLESRPSVSVAPERPFERSAGAGLTWGVGRGTRSVAPRSVPRTAPEAAPPRPPPPRPLPRPPDAAPQPLPPTDAAALIKRLRREVGLLRSNDAWVVLGVPHDADRDMVQRAGKRMQMRYSELVEKESGEARELAKAMLDGVMMAAATLAASEKVVRPDAPGEEAFRAGLRAMSEGDWATADRRFLAARDENLDSARNLAHAGWARLHNPAVPAAERAAAGLDLLLLAEQLDPSYAEGQYFLASALHRKGDDDGALRRLRRALRAEPGHLAANGLARKLRSPPA